MQKYVNKMFDIFAAEIAVSPLFKVSSDGNTVGGAYRWQYGQAEPYDDLRELTAALGRAATRIAAETRGAAATRQSIEAYVQKISRHLLRMADQAAAEEIYVARLLAAWGGAAGAAICTPLTTAIYEETRGVMHVWGPVRHTTYDRQTGVLTFANDPSPAIWARDLVPAARPYAAAARRVALARHQVTSADAAQAVAAVNSDYTFVVVASVNQSGTMSVVMFGTPVGDAQSADQVTSYIQDTIRGFSLFSRQAIATALHSVSSTYIWLDDAPHRRGHTADVWGALITMVKMNI